MIHIFFILSVFDLTPEEISFINFTLLEVDRVFIGPFFFEHFQHFPNMYVGITRVRDERNIRERKHSGDSLS
ncbi:hypothetical protein ACJX0J_023341, partial [Zea mays]